MRLEVKGGVEGMDQPIICANCGIVIRWQPTIVDGKTYCCLGCAQGGPCTCDYQNLPPHGEVKAMVVRDQPPPQEKEEEGEP